MLNDAPLWPYALVFVAGLWAGELLGLLIRALFARNRAQAPCDDCWLLDCYRRQGRELQRAWDVANAAIDPQKETQR